MMRLSFSVPLLLAVALSSAAEPLPTADGYQGIWYMNQPSKDVYRFKYSGGMATYPQQHIPIAIYSKEANKTFFCYGGANAEGELLHMVAYFDHATQTVPKPRILLNKKTEDAHDNPTMAIDDGGHLWIFSNSHGTSRPSFIHRSLRPYSIDQFELVRETNFSYGQPWFVPGKGFLFLHTLYAKGRGLFFASSQDGRTWNEPSSLAHVAQGHYQISNHRDDRVATAFNYHPAEGGLNARTNLYYLETSDLGKTWATASGQKVSVPISSATSECLVHDYEKEGLLVYLKDIGFDAVGRPVILFLTSEGFASGPENDPRTWRTAQCTGEAWRIRDVTTSDHNYDYGPLYMEADGSWRVIAPTDPGPQPYSTGGAVVMWVSENEGETWERVQSLTPNSQFNHTYVRRPVNAHPHFYALWADGHALEQTESSLYFTDQAGSAVWVLPKIMDSDCMKCSQAFSVSD